MDAGGLSRCSPLTVMLIRILKISLEEIRDPRQYNTYHGQAPGEPRVSV